MFKKKLLVYSQSSCEQTRGLFTKDFLGENVGLYVANAFQY